MAIDMEKVFRIYKLTIPQMNSFDQSEDANVKKCVYCESTDKLIFLKKLNQYYCETDWKRKKICGRCGWERSPETFTGKCDGCDFVGSPLQVKHNMKRRPQNTILKARSRRWNTPSRSSTSAPM